MLRCTNWPPIYGPAAVTAIVTNHLPKLSLHLSIASKSIIKIHTMPQIHHCRDFITLPAPSSSPYHIFFLPGNPGLVEYYAKFLSLLHSTLNQAPSTTHFNIAGCSYAGFETELLSASEQADEHKLYNIAEQVTYSFNRIKEYINQATTLTKDTTTKPKVILVGHSFGTFVIAEMMKWIYTSSTFKEEEQQIFEIIGNIHLFPPIPDLAKSPRGVKAAVIPLPCWPLIFLRHVELIFDKGNCNMEISP